MVDGQPGSPASGCRSLAQEQGGILTGVDAAPVLEPYRWVILASATGGQVGLSLLEQGIPILMPLIQVDFNLSALAVGVFGTGSTLGRFLASLQAGRLVSRYGERKSMLVGGLAAAGCMVAMLLAGTPVVTLALLLAFGICLVPSNIAGVSAMTSWFGRQARGTAVGIRQAGVSTGGVVAALVFPLVVTTLGWRGTFAVAGCVAALIVLVAVYWYRDPARPLNRRAATWRDLIKIAGDRHFALVAVIGTIMLALQYTTLAHVAVFLHGRRHETILLTGELLAAAQVAGIGGRIGWGLLSDRVFLGRRLPVLRLILIVSAFACLDLAFLGGVQSGLGWLPVMVATGAAILGWPTVYLALIAELAPAGEAAAAIGIGLAIALIGGVIGPSLFGLVVDLSHTYDLAWLMLAVAAFLGLVISRFVRERVESAIDLNLSASK